VGLDYASLVQARPDLVMISTCLNGQTARTVITGFGGQGFGARRLQPPDRLGPTASRWVRSAPSTDSLSPRYAALLLAAALLHRRRTGEGQHIDLSQVEAGIVCLTESILTYTANGELLARMATARATRRRTASSAAPTRTDVTAGWPSPCTTTRTGRRLVGVLGRPAWAVDSELATADRPPAARGRGGVAARGLDPDAGGHDVAFRLQTAGLDGRGGRGLATPDDPQIAHRATLPDRRARRPRLPPPRDPCHPVLRDGPQLDAPAPCLGAHTEYVLRELLAWGRRVRPAGGAAGVFSSRP